MNPDKELAPEAPVMEAVAAEASVIGEGVVHFPRRRVGPSFMSPSDLKVNCSPQLRQTPRSWLLPLSRVGSLSHCLVQLRGKWAGPLFQSLRRWSPHTRAE